MIVFVAIAGMVIYLDRQEANRRIAERRAEVTNALNHLRTQIANRTDACLVEISALADWISVDNSFDYYTFDAFSSRLLARHAILRSTTLLEGDIISRTYPLLPEIVGFNVGNDPIQHSAIREMKARNRTVVTGPIALKQGGQGLIIRAPIWRVLPNDIVPSYWGHVSAVISLERLARTTEELAKEFHLAVRLRDDDDAGLTQHLDFGNEIAVNSETVEVSIKVAQESWLIVANTLLPKLVLPANPLGLLVGMLIASISAVGTFLLVLTARRLKLQNVLLERLATTDSLTRTFNRRHITSLCESEFKRAHRTHEPFSIILLDIDHFKSVNDRHGHAVGDAVLRHVADALARTVRTTDYVGRWGGEEFIVVTPNVGLEGALAVAERLRHAVEIRPIDVMSPTNRITASFGVASYHSDDLNIDVIIERADAAMYESKAAGRNSVHFRHISPIIKHPSDSSITRIASPDHTSHDVTEAKPISTPTKRTRP
jgi:diguanylate cyclase (GGDEF)-like protein